VFVKRVCVKSKYNFRRSFCDDESKHAGRILAARNNNIVRREIVERADVLLHSGFKTAQAFVLRNNLITLERIG